ncbi:hypothetical protein KCP74_11355 [Salmonella enterica subsp. enterica]|nr:hypothetical protein KCP74_11355 [Salmonella enterica subsp. enterica]
MAGPKRYGAATLLCFGCRSSSDCCACWQDGCASRGGRTIFLCVVGAALCCVAASSSGRHDVVVIIVGLACMKRHYSYVLKRWTGGRSI